MANEREPFVLDFPNGQRVDEILKKAEADYSREEIDEKFVGLDLVGETFEVEGQRTTGEIFNNYRNNIASGDYSHAEGNYTTASGGVSHAEGETTIASGSKSHAEGVGTTASGNFSHAEGNNTIASGDNSHSEGAATIASGSEAHVEGIYTTAIGLASHAEGFSDVALSQFTEPHDTKEEIEALWKKQKSAGSKFSCAFGDESHIEGGCNLATGVGAHAEGGWTLASGRKSHAEGSGTKAIGDESHAEGGGCEASGQNSHAEGGGTKASGREAHAEGSGTRAFGYGAHAEGRGCESTSDGSHAEGQGTKATSGASHAEGSGTTASGDYSHAEGSGTTSSGFSSHAEGGGTTAYGSHSHSEGVSLYKQSDVIEITNSTTDDDIINTWNSKKFSLAKGAGSHAEGLNSLALGDNSHSEGYQTIANGAASHAEGNDTTASGIDSHAEGGGTTARGANSHAEGSGTTASGDYSHAEGCYTIASSAYQHAQGKYNKEDSTRKYAFIIGNGTGTSARSNAIAIDWNGKFYPNNSETGIDLNDFLNRLVAIENNLGTTYTITDGLLSGFAGTLTINVFNNKLLVASINCSQATHTAPATFDIIKLKQSTVPDILLSRLKGVSGIGVIAGTGSLAKSVSVEFDTTINTDENNEEYLLLRVRAYDGTSSDDATAVYGNIIASI